MLRIALSRCSWRLGSISSSTLRGSLHTRPCHYRQPPVIAFAHPVAPCTWGAGLLSPSGISMAGLEPSLIARRVRTAAAESSADDKGSPQNKAARASDTQGYRLPLFLAYSALGAGLTFGAGSHLDGSVALALTSTLWMGFVLAISLTEAWVKFRAPLLDRHVAVDVGRHVFPALNSVEAALGVTCGLMAWRYGLTDAAHLAIPGVMAALVAAQIIWLTPALGLRAQHLIASSADPAQLSPKQQAALAAIKRVCSEQPLPPGWLHGVYGALEVTKVVLLGAYIWKLVGQ